MWIDFFGWCIHVSYTLWLGITKTLHIFTAYHVTHGYTRYTPCGAQFQIKHKRKFEYLLGILEIWKGISSKLFWPLLRKIISEKKNEAMIVASTTFSNLAVRWDQFLLGAGASSASMFDNLLALMDSHLLSWNKRRRPGGDKSTNRGLFNRY
jgi:hypothetical protein